MAQSDQVVQNATFPTVRGDINDNLAALYSQSSGNSAPAVTVAFQPWVDTSSSPPVWKVRNGSNSAWITVGVLDPAGFNAGGITAIANGGTGATTATAALAALLPSQGGNAGKALVTSGSAATWSTVTGITSSTAVASTGDPSIDFISIPSSVKRITVMLSAISTNGSSAVQIQIGSGSFTTSGYAGSTTVTSTTVNYNSGFVVHTNILAATVAYSTIVLVKVDGNTWLENHSTSSASNAVAIGNGGLSLSGTLDRVRITTVNGTDTFDAGSINILYEG